MEMQVEKSGAVTILCLSGRLDVQTTPSAQDNLVRLIDEGARHLVLDLAELVYVSSVGLRALIFAAKRLKSVGGSLAICSMQPLIRQVFEVAQLGSLLPTYEGRDDAIGAVTA